MIDVKFISKKLKERGFKVSGVADKIGIQYQTLNKNLNNGSFETVNKIAQETKINFFELLLPPEGYAHFYDEQTGDWLGIRKK